MESPLGVSVDPQQLLDIQHTIHFTNSESLRQAIRDFFQDGWDRDSLRDHTILIVGFPAELLVDDDEDNEPLLPRHCKILYLKNLQVLFITMPGLAHGEVSRLFGRLVDRKLEAMNCEYEFRPCGDVKINMGNVIKMPDESWHKVGTEYTTLAVETAVSESDRKGGLDAKIWLESKESHVTQLVAINVSRTEAKIHFGLWKAIPREGNMKALYPRKASEVQSVDFTLAQERPVANGTLSLSFKELLERDPRPGTAEKDLVFSSRELGGVARMVWEDMGFVLPMRMN